MAQLFAEPPGSGPAAGVVGVAVAANVWGTFDYLWPRPLGTPAVGQRIRVPFGRGNRLTLGFVVDPQRPPGQRELKAVCEVIDAAPLLDENLWRLGQWISRYYLAPLGAALAAMVPAAVGRNLPRTETVVYLAAERADWPDRLGPRQRRILDELLEARKQGVEPLPLADLRQHSESSADTVRRLVGRNLVRLDSRPVVLPELTDQSAADEFDLNDEQQTVLAELAGRLEAGFSVTLLHGVTGSGKTEIYVRCIRKVVAAGREAILLVPEIALATQTLQRLLRRLGRVAVLHSGLTDAQRAFYYAQIRNGHAAVVVGPRSAVFAPTRRLGLVIVDEEHEAGYKQDTVPRYHGRDVAIMRASLAGVPVLLGSATPSLESLHNAREGRYHLLRLPRRVRGLPMPALQVVHLRQELQPRRIELIGRTLMLAMAAALDRREQIILLMNRRGYASYVFCPSCEWTLTCDRCTRSMVFHQATQLAMCHYCQDTTSLPEACPACAKKLLLFGLGIQRIEGELTRKFPAARVARMDSDTMTSSRQFHQVLNAFAAGGVDVLLGTQMVAKGLDFPRVSLVGVISADTSLVIPDFRAAERTFQLVVQVAGRAGRADLPGKVVVQTLHPDEPAIRYAATHDYDAFAAAEMPLRRDADLPPFCRMIRFVVRHRDVARADAGAQELAARLRTFLADAPVRMVGPMQASVAKIRSLFRFHLLLYFHRPGAVQKLIAPRMADLLHHIPADVTADVDPLQLI